MVVVEEEEAAAEGVAEEARAQGNLNPCTAEETSG